MKNNWDEIKTSCHDEYNAESVLYRKNGFELFHLKNKDPEIFCGFIFKTPPKDNKGTPHIIEHTVFNGSAKYQVKDPFITLSSGSINSFYNAMTYPDKTVYPFASAVEKDFFNVMSVFIDAMFFPLLKREAFLQEGIRIDLQDSKSELNGIVYNEMLGSYSMHETIVSEYSYRYLFPDTYSRFDSGGEPQHIVKLTYEEFLSYYKQYYRVSNCRCFVYGDIDTEKILDFLDENLFNILPESEALIEKTKLQQQWRSPRTFYVPGPVDGGFSYSVNWLLGADSDPVYLLSVELLAEILLGNQSAPLYKALIDSEIGQDLSSASGLESEVEQLVFSAGLRGIDSADKLKEFQSIIIMCLENLVSTGIEKDLIESSLAKIEFRKREIRGGYPYGFRLMSRMMKSWFNNNDPFSSLNFNDIITGLKHELSMNKSYLEDIIKRELLENTHSSLLCVYPSESFSAAGDKNHLIDNISLKQAEKDAKMFSLYKHKIDSPENIKKMPGLKLEDIPLKIKHDTVHSDPENGIDFYSANTNGIIYLDLAFSTETIDDDLKNYLPLLSRLICLSGTKNRSRNQLANDINLHTGGIFIFTESSELINTQGSSCEYLYVRLPALAEDLDKALEILEDILLNSILDDYTLLENTVHEQKNDFASSILPMGSSFAGLYSASLLSSVMQQEEKWRGIRQFQFLTNINKNWKEVTVKLKDLCKNLFCIKNVKMQVCTDDFNFKLSKNKVNSFYKKLGTTSISETEETLSEFTGTCGWSGYNVNSDVSFTALSAKCPKINEKYHNEHSVIAHYLSQSILWDLIRVNNGAYGASASVNGAEGIFTFMTYRDPEPVDSFSIFYNCVETISKNGIHQSELDKIIISLIGNEFKPLVPEEKSLLIFRWDLYGIDYDTRQRKIDLLREISSSSIIKAAKQLLAEMKFSSNVILGNKNIISKFQDKFPEFPRKVEILSVI